MDSFRTVPRGSVRVALVPSAAVLLLPRLINEAARIGVHIAGRDLSHAAAAAPELLADHDIVVTDRDESDLSEWNARIDATHLLRETLEIVLPPGHHLADSKHISLHELAQCSWISVGIGHMVDDVLRSLALQSGVATRIVQRVDDFRLVEALVLAGVGIALLPRYTATDPRLVRKPVDGVNVARRIEAITRTGAATRPAVAAAITILKETAELVAYIKHTNQ
ncbi:MAG: LysR substrate-binding domain-containing protein [Gordonia sp. (in: high G+C Gram-positive bacteria)]